MSNFKLKRDNFPKKWQDAGLSNVGIKMLDLQMKQHMLIIDNIDRENENSKASMQLQAREQVLQKMQEQIKIRDNLLQLAMKHFSDNDVDVDLDDPKLVNIEEIIKINSSLPPIYSAGANPYRSGNSNNPAKNLGLLKAKYKSKLHQNASLPPMNANRNGGNYFNGKKGVGPNQYSKVSPYGMNSGRSNNVSKCCLVKL
jgi:hypothetical protein